MILDLVTNITISVIIIAILHTIYNYAIEVYTIKRNRDIGTIYNEKYLEILEELRKGDTGSDFLPTHEMNSVQDSLFDYVQTYA